MKDLRGISVSTVRNAILKEFRLQISSSRKKLNMVNILNWKKLKRVKECYIKLYNNDENMTKNITKLAFSNITHEDESFNNFYVYTAAVCDIIFNLNYPDLECAKKLLERHFKKFKVNFLLIKLNLLKFYQNLLIIL